MKKRRPSEIRHSRVNSRSIKDGKEVMSDETSMCTPKGRIAVLVR